MNCPICNKSVGVFSSVSLLDGKIFVHLNCFYKDIPNAPSSMDIDSKIKEDKISKLIEQKANKIIEQYLHLNEES
jgi:hypothetical protein